MNQQTFESPEALATWLESLHECSPDGAVGNRKWQPAQAAAQAVRATLRQAPAQGGVTEADEPIGHPRSETDTRDEIELFLRDAYAAGCHAARATSPMLAITYAHREAPKLRAALSAQQQGEDGMQPSRPKPQINGEFVTFVRERTAPPAQPAERVDGGEG